MATIESSKMQFKDYQNVNPMNSGNIKHFIDIDQINSNPTYKTQLIIQNPDGSARSSIIGILDSNNDFSIDTSAAYEDTLSMPSFADQLNQIAGLTGNLTSSAQYIMQSIRLTEARWAGCANPSFNIKLNIPVIRKGQNPWIYIDQVLRCTSVLSARDIRSLKTSEVASSNMVSGNLGEDVRALENIGDIISNETVLYAPNGYRVKYNDKAANPGAAGSWSDTPVGTTSLIIGDWFHANNMLITNSQTNISGKKHYDGTPMYVTVQVTLQYWRQPTYGEIRSWFKMLQ